MDLSQAKLAEKLGVASNTVARWARDERGISEPIQQLLQFLFVFHWGMEEEAMGIFEAILQLDDGEGLPDWIQG